MSAALLQAPEPLEGFQIKGVEIFRVGEWNGDEYTTEDLDAMVAALPKQGFGVPIIFGHDPGPGAPAQGWVERIYRMGDVLKADFKDLNWSVYTQILDHAYDHVSCEIYWNLKRDGATYTRALKAVALLGAETPAVSGLEPLRNAQFSADQFEKLACASLQVVSRQMATEPNTEIAKTLKEQGDLIAQLSQKLADADKAREASEAAATAALKASNEQIAALKASQTKADLSARADKCKVPAIREHIGHLYEFALTDGATRVAKFSDKDGKTVEKSMSAVLDEIVTWANGLVANRTATLSHSTLKLVPKGDEAADYENASAELDKQAKAYMAEKNLKGAEGYSQATTAVLKSNTELATRYAAERRGDAA